MTSVAPICVMQMRTHALASKLYDSLLYKILALPDDVKSTRLTVPARSVAAPFLPRPFHRRPGAPGKLGSADPDREEFVRQMTANLPDRPAYFSYEVGVNLKAHKRSTPTWRLRALVRGRTHCRRRRWRRRHRYTTRAFFGAGHFPAVSISASAARSSPLGLALSSPGALPSPWSSVRPRSP